MTFRDVMRSVGDNLFAATVPANGGPQPNSGLVDDRRFGWVDVVDFLKAVGTGAIKGAGRATAEQAAQSEGVQKVVKEEWQMKIGAIVTSPIVLIAAAVLGVVLIIRMAK